MDPIIIVGPGRSGTSLLQCILSAHPDITALPETALLRAFLSSSPCINDIYQAARSRLSDTVLSPILNSQSTVSLQTFPLLYNSFVSRVSLSGQILLDKDPRLIEFLQPLKSFLPSCKLVAIVRDPRDILASRKKADWSSSKNLFTQLIAISYQIRSLESFRRCRAPECYVLRYEDLVCSPRETILELCSFLDIQFHPSMLSHEKNSSDLILDHELQWKSNLLNPISASSISSYRSALSQIESLTVEHLFPSYFRQHKYPLSTNSSALNLQISRLLSLFIWLITTSLFLLRWHR